MSEADRDPTENPPREPPIPEPPARRRDHARASRPALTGKSRRVPLVFAFVTITVGLWLLAEALGYGVPPFARGWPIFLVVGGIASLLDFLVVSRRPRSAGQAVLGIGLAVVAFVFSLGYAGWRDTLDWLPAVPLVIGLAMLTTWAAAGRRDRGLFAGALVVLAIGLLGLFARFELLRQYLPSAQLVWAVALLVVGTLVAWKVLRPGS